ncbi:MAG: hypothetical protein Q7K43_03620 [Candidatus Woesearchaeota archaeon]|nr:hypothetical protein [Candidatus Woesearchaeota archaeon]
MKVMTERKSGVVWNRKERSVLERLLTFNDLNFDSTALDRDRIVSTQRRHYPVTVEDTIEITKIPEGYSLKCMFACPFAYSDLRRHFSSEQIIDLQTVFAELPVIEDVRKFVSYFAAYKFIKPELRIVLVKPAFSEEDTPE